MGGVCIAASRFYKSKRNIILGAGILFVAAGNPRFLYVRVCVCLRTSLENMTHYNSFDALFGSV